VLGDLAPLLLREILEPPAGVDAAADGLADDVVGLAEGDALGDEVAALSR